MEAFFESFMVTPEYWPAFILWIPLGVVLVILYVRSNSAVRIWFRPHEYTFFFPEIKLIFRGVAIVFLTLSMLGPWWGRLEQQIDQLGREVYFLIDVSASMNCDDIKPSRIQKVKKEIRGMVNQMKGDRVGLIVFTTDAYVQCPLTNDYKAINLFLDLLGTEQFSSTGTDFRNALSKALDRFVNTDKSEQKITRSIILISDGEHFGDEYASVTERLKQNEITVFPVGVGTYMGGKVPEYRRGQIVGYKKSEDGSLAISKLDDTSLQSLADDFGTKYHRIDDQIDNLDPVLDQIEMQSASVVGRETMLSNVNRYQLFLLISLVTFFASMVWMPLKTSRTR